jgi:hypothetical protein
MNYKLEYLKLKNLKLKNYLNGGSFTQKQTKCGNICCYNIGIMICSRCKIIKYCSKQCQREDWKRHKTECFKISKIKKASIQTMSNDATNTIISFLDISEVLNFIITNKDNVTKKK